MNDWMAWRTVGFSKQWKGHSGHWIVAVLPCYVRCKGPILHDLSFSSQLTKYIILWYFTFNRHVVHPQALQSTRFPTSTTLQFVMMISVGILRRSYWITKGNHGNGTRQQWNPRSWWGISRNWLTCVNRKNKPAWNEYMLMKYVKVDWILPKVYQKNKWFPVKIVCIYSVTLLYFTTRGYKCFKTIDIHTNCSLGRCWLITTPRRPVDKPVSIDLFPKRNWSVKKQISVI